MTNRDTEKEKKMNTEPFETIEKGIEKSHCKNLKKNLIQRKEKKVTKNEEKKKRITATVIQRRKEKYSKPKEFRTVADGRSGFILSVVLVAFFSSSSFLSHLLFFFSLLIRGIFLHFFCVPRSLGSFLRM